MSKLEIFQVDKNNEDWSPLALFDDWNVRAILKHQDDIITKINSVRDLRKRLRGDLGESDTSWMIVENVNTDEDELYLRSSRILIMWKLQDSTQFNEIFERIEQHGIMNDIREDT